MIGGNKTELIQIKESGEKNAIGERVESWVDSESIYGFLDYMGGQNNFEFKGKIQDTTHLFICDYKPDEIVDLTSENGRMIVDDDVYQILMIDNPMGLNNHIEFYLKYIGGGLGVN